jgi:hypothetical protein
MWTVALIRAIVGSRGRERSLPAVAIGASRDLRGSRRASFVWLPLPRDLVVDLHVVETRSAGALHETNDFAARREGLAFAQRPNFSGFELPRARPNDARSLPVHRGAVKEPDVEGVSVFLWGRVRRHLLQG